MEKKYPIRFKKAIKGSVGGRCINSHGDYDEFLLTGDPVSGDIDKTSVEVYDAVAEKYFVRQNKGAIINGFLIEVSGSEEMHLDVNNSVSDGFLRDLLKQPFMKMKKRVLEFTSAIPVVRLIEFAKQENKPVKTIEFLNSVKKSIDGGESINVIQIDDTKIGSIG